MFSLYEFGSFRLDSARRQVTSMPTGQALELTPRAFDALLFFVQHPGEVLDKSTLMRAIWPNAIVEENNLSQHIFALRRALAQLDSTCQYIATVPRRGYQLVVAARPITIEHRPQPAAEAPLTGTDDPDAYRSYVQARALLARPSESNLREAISLLRDVAARDAHFANAVSGSASAHMSLVGMGFEFGALATVEREAARALALNPALAEARGLLGCVCAFRGKVLEADSHFTAALSLDPTDPNIRRWRTVCVTAPAGHMQRALEDHTETYRLDPADPGSLIVMAFLQLNFARDAEALRYADLAAGLGFAGYALPIPFIRAHVAQRRGLYAEASNHILGMFTSVAGSAEIRAMIELIYSALAGKASKQEAASAIRRLGLSRGVTLLDPVRFARPLMLWATQLGDIDLAYDIADAVIADFRRSGFVRISAGFVAQLWMPEMLAFRRDARLQSIVAELGLSDYWKRFGPPEGCELHAGGVRCHW